MTVDVWSALEKIGAGVAATWLAEHKMLLLDDLDKYNPVLMDHLKAAIEKAEPGGFKMALVSGTLNKILDGLEDEEKAALPTSASALIDWCIALLSAIATVK